MQRSLFTFGVIYQKKDQVLSNFLKLNLKIILIFFISLQKKISLITKKIVKNSTNF